MARRNDQRETGLASPQDGVTSGPSQGDPGRDSAGALRTLALVTMALLVTALTAAACVLSYTSVHRLAGDADVSAQLARIYPFVFDAALVLAGCAVLALRGAGLISRLYSWLCFLVLLAGLAAAGVVHAAGIHVPRHSASIAAAVIPFALVLAGFVLLLALLRHARLRRLGRRRGLRSQPQPARAGTVHGSLPPSSTVRLIPELALGTEPAQPGQGWGQAGQGWDQAEQGWASEVAQPDSQDDQAASWIEPDSEPPKLAVREPEMQLRASARRRSPGGEDQPSLVSADDGSEADQPAAEPPAFERPHSSPTPPGG